MARGNRAELLRLFGGDGAREKQVRFLFNAFVVSVLCTTIAHPTLNIVASFSTVTLLVCLFLLSAKHLRSLTVWLLLAVSVLSGCSGVIFEDVDKRLAESREFCAQATGTTCKVETIEGLYILGIPLQDVSRQAAVRKAQLNKLTATDISRSYGLIGLARITVMGS